MLFYFQCLLKISLFIHSFCYEISLWLYFIAAIFAFISLRLDAWYYINLLLSAKCKMLIAQSCPTLYYLWEIYFICRVGFHGLCVVGMCSFFFFSLNFLILFVNYLREAIYYFYGYLWLYGVIILLNHRGCLKGCCVGMHAQLFV